MLLHSLPFWHQMKHPGLLDSILSSMAVNWLAGWQVSRNR
jgi:hypothetical protein